MKHHRQATESAIREALQSTPDPILVLEQCPITSLRFLEDIPGLQELQLLSCFSLETDEYETIAALKLLKRLSIDFSLSLTSLQFLSGLTQLEKLEIVRCTEVEGIEPLVTLTNLKHLDLASSGQAFIENFDPIQNLKKLEYLDLSNLVSLRDLHFLEGFTHLRYLNVNFCTLLEDISALKNIHSLQALHVSECDLIEPELGFILQRKLAEFTPPAVVAERRGPPTNFIKV